jgi:stalled ribosome alternative rescue factor ArfA
VSRHLFTFIFASAIDRGPFVWYIMTMKARKAKPVKARVSPQGFMGSASREHRVKKGKGSFRRNPKHKSDCE